MDETVECGVCMEPGEPTDMHPVLTKMVNQSLSEAAAGFICADCWDNLVDPE